MKRCVGLPGQTLEIKDRIIYLDGKANKEPDNVQYRYLVKTKRPIPCLLSTSTVETPSSEELAALVSNHK